MPFDGPTVHGSLFVSTIRNDWPGTITPAGAAGVMVMANGPWSSPSPVGGGPGDRGPPES